MRIHRMFVIIAALTLSGVFAIGGAAQTAFWSCPRGYEGETLSVYNWTTYIAEDTISNFERLCGVTVNYNTYASDSDMLDELREGNPGYDVVVPTNSTVYLMVDEDLLAPINFSNIPNFANVGSQFKNPPHDPRNSFTAAYQWGTIGVGYNRTAVGRDITSWNDVFNYEGPVAWLDEYRTMFGFALLMLGYNPNTSNPTEIGEATQYLIDHSANVTVIAPDTGQDLLAAGTVDIAIEYSGDIFQVIASCGCDDYRYLIPDEGAQLWTDSLAIPTGAPNRALAEVFIDYILNAQVGADIANYTAYASPNAVAISEGLISSEYLDNEAIYPPGEVLNNLFYNVADASLEQMYSDAWNVVLASVNR